MLLSNQRCKFAREALASSQGDAPPDRYRNLSRHRKAELLGETMPHVHGANHRRTEAYNARALARLEEQMYKEQVGYRQWCAEHKREKERMCRNVDALWDKAYRISKKSWHPMEPRKNRGSLRKPYTRILAATNPAPVAGTVWQPFNSEILLAGVRRTGRGEALRPCVHRG